MSLVVGLSAGMTSYTEADLVEEDIPQDFFEQPVEQDEINNAPPADATAFQRLAYAFDIYENGKGYTSTSSQVIDIIGNIQYSTHNKYRGGGMDITEEWYKMTGLASSYGRNRFLSNYSNGVDMNNIIIDNSKYYNYDNKTYDVKGRNGISSFTTEHWLTVSKMPKLNSFFTPVNPNTAEITKYDNKGRGKDYYTVVASLDLNKLDENFLHAFESNGAAGLNINNIYVTFKIAKTTGYFMSIVATGSITATYVPLNISAAVEMTYKEVFSSMNRSAESKILQLRKQNFDF